MNHSTIPLTVGGGAQDAHYIYWRVVELLLQKRRQAREVAAMVDQLVSLARLGCA